jgi:hypothetical protein
MKGIIFNVPSNVHAILNTRIGERAPIDPVQPWKWQTRRPIKDQPPVWAAHPSTARSGYGDVFVHWTDGGTVDCACWPKDEPIRARYRPGDVCYVKETWMTQGADSREALMKSCQIMPDILYRADREMSGFKWRSSMMMPAWAARAWVRIDAVRCERLNDISEEDAIAEGVAPMTEPIGMSRAFPPDFLRFQPHASAFADLWNELHGPGAWEANPWLWVYSFTRVERPEAI